MLLEEKRVVYFIYSTITCFTFSLGWQPRWFVLEGGTLSYYDSQEDAWKGCKGSIKVCVCEIQGGGRTIRGPDRQRSNIKVLIGFDCEITRSFGSYNVSDLIDNYFDIQPN